MPFFNPNVYYNPFANPGIFGVYGSQADFIRDLRGVRTPVLPPKPAPGWEGVERPSPLQEIEQRMAAGGPTFNTATQLNNAATGGTGGGAGGTDQATQGYGILPWLGVGLYGVNTLGNLYLGHEALNQGWAQFRFQRDLANQNLANSIQAYNNALRARLRGRSGAFSEEDIDRMMEGRKLEDTRKRK